jgi:hypothetical protein
MTVETDCFICGEPSIGIFKTHKTKKSVPMCADCSREVFKMHRVINRPKEVSNADIW